MLKDDESLSEFLLPQKRLPFFRRCAAWLLSQKYFQIKVLSGTAIGVLVITLLAGLFIFMAYRDQEQERIRTHTVKVMRLSSVIEGDIAALETGYRGFLLTGKASYLEPFERRRVELKNRVDMLGGLIQATPAQRKRVMKLQEFTQLWVSTVALPEMSRPRAGVPAPAGNSVSATTLGNSILEQARDVLQSIQNEEQLMANTRMRDREWAALSIQILDLLPKLDRSAAEMEKEKRGYLLTGDSSFVEAYKRAITRFSSYHGYLSILVANGSEQPTSLAEIRTKAELWIKNSAAPEMEAKRLGQNVSVALIESGDALMAEIRERIAAFEKKEMELYEVRSIAAERQRTVRNSGLGILCLLAISLLVVPNGYSCALVQRQLSKLNGVEARIKSVIENILDGMITVDEEGVICSMNPAAEKMFDCIDNEMVGHKFVKVVPKCYPQEPDAPPLPCAWNDLACRTGSTTLALGRTRRHATFPIEISLNKMTVDGQKLFVAMIRDVTEQKRFEREIASDKESLAVTLRAIGDGVITTDVKGKIIMINKAGEELTGWNSSDAIGQQLKTVFNVAVDLAAQARTQKSGSRNEAQSILLNLPESATLLSREGAERIIEQVASPIRDNKNEVAGVVLVFRDITERQRSEAERSKADALEQLGLLAGGIAHDFNNLLTVIIGNISLASLQLTPGDEMGTRLNDANNASMRARDLAQQLLTFARGGAPIKKTTSIARLIEDTVSFSLRGTQSRSRFTFGPDLWPAEIDLGQISQVIGNLAVNADQAMPNGGTLHVSCDNFVSTPNAAPAIPDLRPGEYVRISIRDEGVGIAEEHLKRIFDPYFTTKAKGTGLGLATTYSIIKNHGGLITVDSQIHFGSTFTVYLPASCHEIVPLEMPRNMGPVITGTGRILIVDDEEAIRALVEFTLSELGYEVAGAETAVDGVDLYRQKLKAGQRFDAVILDLTLPGGMGGKEALKCLMELDPTVNAIVSSGYATDSTMSRYQDFGFRGVIAKPYEAAELGRTVYDIIQSSRVNLAVAFEEGRLASRVA